MVEVGPTVYTSRPGTCLTKKLSIDSIYSCSPSKLSTIRRRRLSAFTNELTEAITKLVSKYHDESAPRHAGGSLAGHRQRAASVVTEVEPAWQSWIGQHFPPVRGEQ